MKFGYARVSTKGQDLTRQITALENAKCDEIYYDKKSGKDMNRDELNKLLSRIRKNDTIVVTDIDRLGRNFTEISDLYDRLKKMGVSIVVLNQSLLNYSPNDSKDEIINVVVVPLLIYLAERERTTLIERIQDGIKNLPVDEIGKKYSRKTGRCVGRPSKAISLSKEETAMLQRVRNNELSVTGFCKYMHISRASYYKYYKNYKLEEII
jgi:site-specific recombinase, resolvase family